jgi:hypothetical protein
MRFSQPSDRLTVRVGEAVKFVFFFTDLPLNPLDAIHRASVPRDLRDQRLVADLHEGFVDFVTKPVVAAEAEQLLIRIIRRGTVVVIRGGVNFTLVYHSSLVHTPPYYRVHSHPNPDPLGFGDALSVGSGDTEGDVVLPAIADKAVGSGG